VGDERSACGMSRYNERWVERGCKSRCKRRWVGRVSGGEVRWAMGDM